MLEGISEMEWSQVRGRFRYFNTAGIISERARDSLAIRITDTGSGAVYGGVSIRRRSNIIYNLNPSQILPSPQTSLHHDKPIIHMHMSAEDQKMASEDV